MTWVLCNPSDTDFSHYPFPSAVTLRPSRLARFPDIVTHGCHSGSCLLLDVPDEGITEGSGGPTPPALTASSQGRRLAGPIACDPKNNPERGDAVITPSSHLGNLFRRKLKPGPQRGLVRRSAPRSSSSYPRGYLVLRQRVKKKHLMLLGIRYGNISTPILLGESEFFLKPPLTYFCASREQ